MGRKKKTLYILTSLERPFELEFQGLKDIVVVAVYTLGQFLLLNFVIYEPSLCLHRLTLGIQP